MLAGTKTAVISILLVGAAIATPTKSGYISDVETKLAYHRMLELSDRAVNLTISYEVNMGDSRTTALDLKWMEADHSVSYIKNHLYSSNLMLSEFNTGLGLPTSDCKQNYNLNVFIVSNTTMFDDNRFDSYLNKQGKSPSERAIYAFYDPTPRVAGDSNVVLSPIGNDRQDYLSIQHELAHFWFDRLCLAKHYSGTSEDYALEYEKHAIKYYYPEGF